jgi:penicillin amidase
MLEKWDNKLFKNSVEATIYVNFERQLIYSFYMEYVPEEVRNLLGVQLYKIIEKINSFEVEEKNNFLENVFMSSVQDLKNRFGSNVNDWIYGQSNYKHIKVSHSLDDVVNDSINKIISFKTYPRGGNSYTPGSTGSGLNQSSGASFRVIIDTKDWDNSIATNSPGQSGDPSSPFYRNLYESWANDEYFKLLYSKDLIAKNAYNKIVYYPKK